MASSDKEDNGESGSSVIAGALAPIASPLAGKKLHKRVMKLVKKAAKDKILKRGVKEVVKCIRKGAKGVVVLAGDISPIDVLSHMPVICEEAGIPYVYVTSKADLGIAGATKRATSCVLVTPPKADADYRDVYDSCSKEMAALIAQ